MLVTETSEMKESPVISEIPILGPQDILDSADNFVKMKHRARSTRYVSQVKTFFRKLVQFRNLNLKLQHSREIKLSF